MIRQNCHFKEEEMSKMVKRIINAVDKCWVYMGFGGKKKKGDILHHMVERDDDFVNIWISPQRVEVVGGKHDGKSLITKFVFDAGLFASKMLKSGFDIDTMALITRPSKKQQDSLVVMLRKKKVKYRLQILTRPASEIDTSKKIRCKGS